MSRTAFERIKYIEVNNIILNCPIDIEKGALVLDKQKDRVLLQLKLLNVSDQRVSSVFVNVDSFDDANDLIQGIDTLEHSYLDLSLDSQKSYGEKNPIALDKKVRNVKVILYKVVFESGDIWRSDDKDVYMKPSQDNIDSLGPELLNVLQLQARSEGINADKLLYLPLQLEKVWVCSCGRVNEESILKCKRCMTDKNWIFLNTSTDYLSDRNEEIKSINERKVIEAGLLKRKKNEELLRLEEAKNVKSKKIKKRVMMLSVTLSLLAIILTIAIKVIIPNNKYNKAIELMNNKEYSESIEVLNGISTYKDSETLIVEAKYLTAVKFKDEGKIIEAIKYLETVIPYKDSVALKLEYEYSYAIELYEEGEIDESIELLSQIENYKDSQELIHQYKYEYGKSMAKNGDIVTALLYLERDYKDSNEIINNLKIEKDYQNALGLFESKNYRVVIPILERLNDYKDTKSMLMKARYIYAEKLFDSSNFFEAKQLFNKVEGEFDVGKYLNTKYYMIEGNWKNLTKNRIEKIFHNFAFSIRYKNPYSNNNIDYYYKWDKVNDVLIYDGAYGNVDLKVISIKADTMELLDMNNGITMKYQRVN